MIKLALFILAILVWGGGCAMPPNSPDPLLGTSLSELRQCAGIPDGEHRQERVIVLDYSRVSTGVIPSRLPYAMPGTPMVASGHCAASVTIEDEKVTDVRYQPGPGSTASTCDAIFMDCNK
jgi:hypothetical protein